MDQNVDFWLQNMLRHRQPVGCQKEIYSKKTLPKLEKVPTCQSSNREGPPPDLRLACFAVGWHISSRFALQRQRTGPLSLLWLFFGPEKNFSVHFLHHPTPYTTYLRKFHGRAKFRFSMTTADSQVIWYYGLIVCYIIRTILSGHKDEITL